MTAIAIDNQVVLTRDHYICDAQFDEADEDRIYHEAPQWSIGQVTESYDALWGSPSFHVAWNETGRGSVIAPKSLTALDDLIGSEVEFVENYGYFVEKGDRGTIQDWYGEDGKVNHLDVMVLGRSEQPFHVSVSRVEVLPEQEQEQEPFPVGTKVRVTGDSGYANHGLPTGTTGEVVRVVAGDSWRTVAHTEEREWGMNPARDARNVHIDDLEVVEETAEQEERVEDGLKEIVPIWDSIELRIGDVVTREECTDGTPAEVSRFTPKPEEPKRLAVGSVVLDAAHGLTVLLTDEGWIDQEGDKRYVDLHHLIGSDKVLYDAGRKGDNADD